jgi:hypothetical protein
VACAVAVTLQLLEVFDETRPTCESVFTRDHVLYVRELQFVRRPVAECYGVGRSNSGDGIDVGGVDLFE